jgi:hypothetical protein
LKGNDSYGGDRQDGMGAPKTLPQPWGNGKIICFGIKQARIADALPN